MAERNKNSNGGCPALLVERKGAGIVLGGHSPYGHVSTQALRQAADTVLNNPRYAQAAQAVGRSVHEAGGYLQAVSEIESMLSENAESQNSTQAEGKLLLTPVQ